MLYSEYMLKTLKSATSNWLNKNDNASLDNLIVKTVFVDEGVALKRLRTAPQGRAHRIRKDQTNYSIVRYYGIGKIESTTRRRIRWDKK